jgi:hypothetical protein
MVEADGFADDDAMVPTTNVVERVIAAVEKSGLRLVDVFNAMDLDRSKDVTSDELIEGLRRVNGLELPDDDLRELVDAFDTDGNGEISLKEWKDGMENPERFQELQEKKQRQREQLQRSQQLNSSMQETEGNFEMASALEEMKLREEQSKFGDIHTACWEGNARVVERFLREAPNLAIAYDESEWGDGNTPLHYAAYNNHLEVCRLLCEEGEWAIASRDVNAPNSKASGGVTALFMACQQGHADVVEYLLGKGADPLVRDTKHRYSVIDVSDQPIRDIFKQKYDQEKLNMQQPSLSKPKVASITVEWSEPRVVKLPVSGYKIKLTPVDENGSPTGFPVVVLVNAARMQRQVHNLDPGVLYVAQVAAMTLKGHGKFSEPSEQLSTENEAPTIRGGLRLVEGPFKNSVVLELEQGRANGVHQYLLQVATGRNGKWALYQGGGFAPDDRFEVTDLNQSSLYRFRMCAENGAGRGNYSEDITVTTTDQDAPESEDDEPLPPPKLVGATVEVDSDESDYIEGYDEEDDTDDDDMYSDGFDDDD